MATPIVSNWNDTQRAEIAEELNRILADPRFTSSQRCSSLLQHLVELALNGDHDRIKERSLGVEVFRRDPDYDANADPIVRRIAGETRKRLAQHYQDENARHGVRIRMEPGSYLPHFEFERHELLAQESGDRVPTQQPATLEAEFEERREPSSQTPYSISRKWAFVIAAIVLTLGTGLTVFRSDFWRSTDYLIWKPLLNSKSDLIVCVSDRPPVLLTEALTAAKAEAAKGVGAEPETSIVNIATASRPRLKVLDVASVLKISRYLNASDKNITLVPSSALNTRNLGNGPIILIGSVNYPLSMMVESKLRYSIHQSDPNNKERWIADSQNPSNHDWKVFGTPEQSGIDYAMVTRFWDPDTGGWVMMVSGIGPFGTEAAVNLVTDPTSSKLIPSSIRFANNFQIVLKTVVIDGTAGVPQILAVHTW